ncbi:MAG: cell division protein FtsQ/DivIB [Aquabacterium sp.]|uniref:cell division protein FtsQ/DivIB n=1 Tax=Aquabacterium sp. TaxID=1872578 RepID=UPI001B5714A3|nr:cell division protein FtsQ/DivIB [Aquabacterium sp.]MBP7131934.1 cell division protein FtsQ/DivIB [Aquabacterium sp.]MDQ5925288.1 cell division protein FtsQ [Pseudomonadota bacterium]
MLAAAALNRYTSPDETPQDVRWMNAAAAALVLVAVLMVLASGLLKLARVPYFDLQRVQLEGDLQRNNLATVRANTVPRLYGGFFEADLQRSRGIFESVPWVRKAVVRRVWPNQLRVTLEEHQPAAYWRQAHSEDQLVNTFGEVFDANLGDVEDEHLPTLEAPATTGADQSAHMLQMLHRLQTVFKTLGEVETLKLSDRGSWSLQLDDEAQVVLGRGSDDEVIARAERFAATLPELRRHYPAPLSQADLRYPQGYAVKLRGLTTLQDGAAPPKQPQFSTR